MSHKQAKRERKTASRYSNLSHLQQTGRILTPPWMNLPKLKPSSWSNERLPEMIWASLLITHLERETALDVFRRLANYFSAHADQVSPRMVTQSGLAAAPNDIRKGIISTITSDRGARLALNSLLLLDNLPARSSWAEALGESVEMDWGTLMTAVARTLDHQSQESTDCRWVKILSRLAMGKLHLGEESAREIIGYPHVGDQRKVRPTIRATEIAFVGPDDEAITDWPEHFWTECLARTPCAPFPEKEAVPPNNTPSIIPRVDEVYENLCRHALATRSTSSVDAKHDTVFGTSLYCVGLLREIVEEPRCGKTILGRVALRITLECFVTLAYLVKKNNLDLWRSYRVYGAGQAKLSFLKLEGSDTVPGYVSLETLEVLANEDQWQEFLPIDLGHWDKTNLRKMSEEAGLKDVYDMFYSWPSSYVHGHWGAIRDSTLTTCLNPLHRLHRIPRIHPRVMNDVTADIVSLIDRILVLVDGCYPAFPARIG